MSVLKVENLTMRFGGLTAIDNVSFTLEPGRITALIGPNGAGKTTLFNCLTGFYQPSAGHIYINDTTCITQWPTHRIVQEGGIARTFQNIRLFKQLNALENVVVALGAKDFTCTLDHFRDRACALLKRVDLEHLANHRADQLPYGAQRRLEIARALALNPKILCLDEPAAGLNHSETEELRQLLLSLQKELSLTIFLIEHDMPFVMNTAEHIVVLNYGVKIAEGDPASIRKNPNVIAAYLGEDTHA